MTQKVLLYGDVSINIIDGSSIWLTSMAEALARAGATVEVLLKASVTTPTLAAPLSALDGVRLLDADRQGNPYSVTDAASRIAHLHQQRHYDMIVTRGLDVGAQLASMPHLARALWPYLTDYPQSADELVGDKRDKLELLASNAHRILVQTEDSRSYLEWHIPAAAGKTLIIPPMIPLAPSAEPVTGDELRLVYAGKFASNWHTLQMCQLPTLLAARGVPTTLTMIGDKFQRDAHNPAWVGQMKDAISHSPGVHWVGALPRQEVLAELSRHHLGLGWRSAALDSSHELSTKLLEYMSVGLLPVVNDTTMHRELLGADYPLLVDDQLDRLVDAIATWWTQRADDDARRVQLRQVSQAHTIDAAADRLRHYLERYVPFDRSCRPQQVLVAGHDFKFAAELFDYLNACTSIHYKVDTWRSMTRHNAQRSLSLLRGADTIFCEWAGENAAWFAEHKKPGQRLIVRLHGFEARTGAWESIDADAVDTLLCPSPRYAQMAADVGFDPARVRVIPNTIDVLDLDRPKLPDARFHLAHIGLVPTLKRPDRTLAVFRELLALDPRYVLHLRGRLPNEYPWIMRNRLVQRYYTRLYREFLTDPTLAPHVSLDYFGPDMGSYLRRIGWVLGPSTEESFHLAPLEGMASGAIPVIWQRPGVHDVYGPQWVHSDDPTSIAAHIHATTMDEQRWNAVSAQAQEQAADFDVARIRPLWADVFS